LVTIDERLGYQFNNRSLLEQALCHRSAGKPNNERLEFLGDAVLGFVVSELLYRRFPEADEGELSRLRSQLVQRSTLAELARDLRLGEVLRLGPGELKSGGAERESILADAMEALVSAIYLDGGLAACEERVRHWMGSRMQALLPSDQAKDAKTRLQEWLQARRKPLPGYSVQQVSGSGHQQVFTIQCVVEGLPAPLSATGTTRKEAEQKVAAQALQLLGETGG
jgi:ribonuclease-3